MTLKDEFLPIYKLRIEEDEKCLPELPDYWETSPAIQAEIALLTRNLQDTVDFLDNDCDGDQLAYIMEVADEISAKLQSWEFIDALYRAADKFPTEEKKHRIKDKIQYAIGQLNDDVYEQRYKLKKTKKEEQNQSITSDQIKNPEEKAGNNFLGTKPEMNHSVFIAEPLSALR